MVELETQKHVQFILSKATVRYKTKVLMEHIRLNGANWGLTTLDLLGKIDSVDVNEVVSEVLRCQHESGGFGGNIGHDPHILFILSAVQVLALFDKVDVLDVERVANLSSASCCLALLHRLDKTNVEKAVDYILSCKNHDGGFGCTPGGESHAGQISVMWVLLLSQDLYIVLIRTFLDGGYVNGKLKEGVLMVVQRSFPM